MSGTRIELRYEGQGCDSICDVLIEHGPAGPVVQPTLVTGIRAVQTPSCRAGEAAPALVVSYRVLRVG